jgi:DNA-binding IclR family transcriptional regulator
LAGDQPNIVAHSSTRTLERGLAILDCYDLDHWGHTLTEVCSQTGLAKATAFRLLKTLERCGYLTMDPVTNRYCLGPSMMKAAYVMVSHAELERLAHPLLEKLVRITNETAVLTAWAAERTITLDFVATPLPVKPYVRAGQMLNDLNNAHTQLYLAYMPADERQLIVSQHREAETGPGTPPVDPAGLEERLEQVRAHGVAYDLETRILGVCGVAAPAFDADGQVGATLGIIAPTERFMEGMNDYAAPLKEAARELSRLLGYKNEGDTQP